jgi:hypothetical protein
MSILFPRFKLRFLPRMLGIAFLVAIAAGIYGVLHDQVTYSISPEHFSKLKFNQFHFANFGLPNRVFVSEIGFIAAGSAGFFSGWFLARIAVPAWPGRLAFRRAFVGFSVIFTLAFAAAAIGYVLGLRHSADYSHWQGICFSLGVANVPAFVRVAYIHNASYVGGLIGLIAAITFLQRLKKSENSVVGSGWKH